MERTIETVSSRQAWSTYWQTSSGGAIDLRANDPVAESLRRHWGGQLPWLAKCQRVADVGSGPAVLAQLLYQMDAPGMAQLRWICIDHADLPEVPDLPPAIQLRGRVDFAREAADAEGVDAVLGNFGLEYVDREALAAACTRWLRPGGRLHGVMHVTGSVIDRVSTEAAADIAWALDEVGLHRATRPLLEAMAVLPEDPIDRMMHGVDARDAYNLAVNHLKQRMEDRGAYSAALLDMLNATRHLMAIVQAGDLEAALQALDARTVAMVAEVGRLADMRRSALAPADLDALTAGLRTAGLVDVAVESIACALGSVAVAVTARKP